MRQARPERQVVDRDAALRLIEDASQLVDAAVRQRLLFSGAPFTPPGQGPFCSGG